jgi:hypothetical protein
MWAFPRFLNARNSNWQQILVLAKNTVKMPQVMVIVAFLQSKRDHLFSRSAVADPANQEADLGFPKIHATKMEIT